MCVRTRMCAIECVRAYMHNYVSGCRRVLVYVCVRAYVCARACVCVYVCACAFISTSPCLFTYHSVCVSGGGLLLLLLLLMMMMMTTTTTTTMMMMMLWLRNLHAWHSCVFSDCTDKKRGRGFECRSECPAGTVVPGLCQQGLTCCQIPW